MFEFLLSIRVSFRLVRVGRMPNRCAETLPFFLGKDILLLSFLFCLRGGGGVEEGRKATDTFLGSLESKVSLDEISH